MRERHAHLEHLVSVVGADVVEGLQRLHLHVGHVVEALADHRDELLPLSTQSALNERMSERQHLHVEAVRADVEQRGEALEGGLAQRETVVDHLLERAVVDFVHKVGVFLQQQRSEAEIAMEANLGLVVERGQHELFESVGRDGLEVGPHQRVHRLHGLAANRQILVLEQRQELVQLACSQQSTTNHHDLRADL